jgi:hypothetical protein
MLAHARKAAIVSGMFGMYATTRSPRWTPSDRSPAAIRAVCSRSSPHDKSATSRSSPAWTAAGSPAALPRKMCSA